jgi:hypothetical protein
MSPTGGGRMVFEAAFLVMPNSLSRMESSIRVADRKKRRLAFAKLGTASMGTRWGVISSFLPGARSRLGIACPQGRQ